MCKFYLYRHPCAHTTSTFAQYCPAAAHTQTPCATPSSKEVWLQFRVDDNCPACYDKDTPAEPAGFMAGGGGGAGGGVDSTRAVAARYAAQMQMQMQMQMQRGGGAVGVAAGRVVGKRVVGVRRS
ncbi:hypothetical protein EJ05DRAFT_482403 [Pseudovirgaria hyperparasitica]|uniref:Uncharacterized protein n=1 Tax=Pseudovirgaria hyperparasitica TaxID=470096 RepID=A0A6A6WJK3_9PEZI|nr:uncharacterized protein EJ05DRAFT_482403 [Pseudovirgaria hyperparasitica]KAF2761531.1 hypothetical protein EJ05DRAFT_482403 [Pseudovirgaria hyperparasitica]